MNRDLEQALRLATTPPVGVSVEALEDLALDDPAASWDVAQAAGHLGVSAHTLRYDSRAIRRLVFITRMRTAGMPIADLRNDLNLVDQGQQTTPQRLALMLEHRDTLRRQIGQLQLALAATEYKIATYQEGPTP